ncbi:hypothetical protein D1BOALGB6SA_6321 [Olavius sp. associated proteobacterium Delta 1]|nr:hypothetical protein D1BOALGB6SA_6321 [Olavius sp. associated proteobacterium Delta 1]
MRFGDLDGNGNLHLTVANSGSDDVSVLLDQRVRCLATRAGKLLTAWKVKGDGHEKYKVSRK